MNKIIIKKESEDVTYKNITTMHIFNVNGKEVRVYAYDKQDMTQSDYENDTIIDEDDEMNLTEEENEVLDDQLYELCNLKVGKTIKIDGWE